MTLGAHCQSLTGGEAEAGPLVPTDPQKQPWKVCNNGALVGIRHTIGPSARGARPCSRRQGNWRRASQKLGWDWPLPGPSGRPVTVRSPPLPPAPGPAPPSEM